MLSLRLESMPDLLAIHAEDPKTFPYLLMSGKESGWDILMALPQNTRIFKQDEGALFVAETAKISIQSSQSLVRAANVNANNSNEFEFPFTGGWFVYAAYDVLSEFEPSVTKALDDSFPLAALAQIPAAILIHKDTQSAFVMSQTQTEQNLILAKINASSNFVLQTFKPTAWREDAPEHYLNAIDKLQKYIHDGDVFQVNISRAWELEVESHIRPADIFARLREVNPAPFSSLIDLGEAQIISSSPERLAQVSQGKIVTRPIAGTHARSLDPLEDAAQKERLIASTKERAEHVMLIDLERNDLGRICSSGSVVVEELMAVTSYAYVHHIESTVSGYLQDNLNLAQVLRALFPGGTITGCPKVRTMQIIRELEMSARRAYTGSLGYVNFDGSMDLNILIRTIMKEQGRLRLRAGGGIVVDSNAEKELQETRHKARGLLRALGLDDA